MSVFHNSYWVVLYMFCWLLDAFYVLLFYMYVHNTDYNKLYVCMAVCLVLFMFSIENGCPRLLLFGTRMHCPRWLLFRRARLVEKLRIFLPSKNDHCFWITYIHCRIFLLWLHHRCFYLFHQMYLIYVC